MLHWQDERLAQTDPAVQNLEVARGIPQFRDLEIRPYCEVLDEAARGFARWLPLAEEEFEASRDQWGLDTVSFRVGMLCQYIEQSLGVRYIEEQKDVEKIRYRDPSDLFLNGVLDKRQGTCGNMAVLYHCLCWRLGWPVSLAFSGWHAFCRYDDGKTTVNVETTAIGEGGFSLPGDRYYIERDGLLPEHIRSGSDLTALRPRQVLGSFFGSRGRYWFDVYLALPASEDYGRAARLFPESRLWRGCHENALVLAATGVTPPDCKAVR
jgi:hypothetical protein